VAVALGALVVMTLVVILVLVVQESVLVSQEQALPAEVVAGVET
jgi:hypothetical protein